MKSIVVFFVFFVSVIFFSCKSDNPIENSTVSTSKGQILLKIDRTNAPSNIIEVSAKLTREGFPAIISTLNFLSDTSADLTMNAIPVGVWHLKVDASDSSGTVMYSGETDVNIVANFITQVSLTLSSTGSGVGSIYIIVNWGQTTNWIDYNNNPVLVANNSNYQTFGIAQQYVIFDGDKYKMWYMGTGNSAYTAIFYAESINGISWTHPTINPVIYPGPFGSWDSRSVQPGAIIKHNGVFRMYYFGYSDPYGVWSIGLAESNDGITWVKHPTPVLAISSTNEFQAVSSSILKVGDLYYLYYVIRNYPQNKICLATSPNGINWSNYSGNPILTATNSWEGAGVAEPSVINDNGTFKMVYMNSVGTAFGFATSSDGKSWTKQSNQPFFKKENTYNNWANGSIAYPCYIKVGNEYRIYYSGYSSNEDKYKIGFMRKF